MSSDSEPAAKKKVKHSRLCMDSDDELRAEQSEEERRKRKQEKMQRKRQKELQRERRQREREERERQREQEEEQEEEELDYNILLQEDSNSHTSYTRVRQNIKEAYPTKKDHWEQKPIEKKPKKDREPKVKKAENDTERKEEESVQKTKSVPAKPTGKDQLVYEFAKRWWYVMPAEWPPKDFDYASELEKDGYRIVPQESFRKQLNVVNGLTKVHEVDGYRGIFKSPNKIIDVRPKDSCPSIENFRKLSTTDLTDKIRLALEKQIADLQRVEHKQNGDEELMKELNVLLLKYGR